MRLMKCTLIVLLLALPLSATTIRVPSEQPTIQAGIDVAAYGDTVLVAQGTYTGPGNRNIRIDEKIIVLKSENGPEVTIIDCENLGNGVQFRYFGLENAKLEGFTIQNGNSWCGGGIFCVLASPSISDCVICGNVADYGGGISCNDYSSPSITGCIISGNTAHEMGGGIWCNGYSSPVVACCIISENFTGYGGGISCTDSSPDLFNTIFMQNIASYNGGAVDCQPLFCGCAPYFCNCTFVENEAYINGGGIHYTGHDYMGIRNCILWNDLPQEIFPDSGEILIGFSDIRGGWEGEGNIDLDPRFVPFPVRGFEYLLQTQFSLHRRRRPIDRGPPLRLASEMAGLVSERREE